MRQRILEVGERQVGAAGGQRGHSTGRERAEERMMKADVGTEAKAAEEEATVNAAEDAAAEAENGE